MMPFAFFLLWMFASLGLLTYMGLPSKSAHEGPFHKNAGNRARERLNNPHRETWNSRPASPSRDERAFAS